MTAKKKPSLADELETRETVDIRETLETFGANAVVAGLNALVDEGFSVGPKPSAIAKKAGATSLRKAGWPFIVSLLDAKDRKHATDIGNLTSELVAAEAEARRADERRVKELSERDTHHAAMMKIVTDQNTDFKRRLDRIDHKMSIIGSQATAALQENG